MCRLERGGAVAAEPLSPGGGQTCSVQGVDGWGEGCPPDGGRPLHSRLLAYTLFHHDPPPPPQKHPGWCLTTRLGTGARPGAHVKRTVLTAAGDGVRGPQQGAREALCLGRGAQWAGSPRRRAAQRPSPGLRCAPGAVPSPPPGGLTGSPEGTVCAQGFRCLMSCSLTLFGEGGVCLLSPLAIPFVPTFHGSGGPRPPSPLQVRTLSLASSGDHPPPQPSAMAARWPCGCCGRTQGAPRPRVASACLAVPRPRPCAVQEDEHSPTQTAQELHETRVTCPPNTELPPRARRKERDPTPKQVRCGLSPWGIRGQ